MEKRQLRLAVVVLAVINVLTIVFFLSRTDSEAEPERVATIGNETITRQEWLRELERRYGEETLRGLIEKEVIKQMASRYDVAISKSALEQELTMYKVLYGSPGLILDGDEWEQQVETSLILEELLIKDVVIPEDDLKKYYQQHMDLFKIDTSYHLSQIIVKTAKEAEQTVEELEGGSSFEALAMERSLDEFSANHGGDIGFISEEGESLEPLALAMVQEMKPKTWSNPVKLNSGYAIFYLHEIFEGKQYSYKEVKDRIRRQIALEQMEIPVSAQAYWDEADVTWFYGEKSP